MISLIYGHEKSGMPLLEYRLNGIREGAMLEAPLLDIS